MQEAIKNAFGIKLNEFAESLNSYVATAGSGNTANIGSIDKIADILSGNGMFSLLGEEWFDDYWMNYGKITVKDDVGKTNQIKNLHGFVVYRGGDTNLIFPRASRRKASTK